MSHQDHDPLSSSSPLWTSEAVTDILRQRRGSDAVSPAYEDMLAGRLYIADDAAIQAATRRAQELAFAYNQLDPSAPDSDKRRHTLLTDLLGHLGANVTVRAPLQVDYGAHLSLGEGTFVNFGLIALDVCPISVGRNCQIATNVQLITAEHPLEPEPRRQGWESGRPISLGNNVWLGAGVIVCPGVTIGDNSVVGAGSVVTRDVPPNVVAVGTPARPIRDLPGTA